MPYQSEMLTFLLGVAVAGFILGNHARLEQLPNWKLLLAAFYVMFAGWMALVMKNFFWREWWNLLEHCCHSASSLLLCAWCWTALVRGKRYEASRQH